MKKRIGKITIGLVCIILALGITWTVTQQAQAATIAGQTLALPSTSTVTHDAATYLVIWDRSNGNLVGSPSGADPNFADTLTATNTWVNAAIATAVHLQNGNAWIATTPSLSSDIEYVMGVYNNASPAKTDVPTQGPFLYDPAGNVTFSDTNPIRRKNVGVRTQ